ncbi:50S ribosomal protein L31 [bacterium HR35]|nr:50S ribosomal protein L31 [bacterium HR35]
MKKNIHPTYFLTKVKCACGAEYEVYGTKKEIFVEVCRNCSPLFTGTEEAKVVIGRVERFRKRYSKNKKEE